MGEDGFVFQGWWLFVLKDFGAGNRLIFRLINSSFGKTSRANQLVSGEQRGLPP